MGGIMLGANSCVSVPGTESSVVPQKAGTKAIRRFAKPTLTVVELHHGETLEFVLTDGQVKRFYVKDTSVEVLGTFRREDGRGHGIQAYRIGCVLTANGIEYAIRREVGTDASFCDPVEVDGVTVWLDTVDCVFGPELTKEENGPRPAGSPGILSETHGRCRPRENCDRLLPPRRHLRLAVQDARTRICPELLHPWCPLPEDGLRIAESYNGSNCWMGPFNGYTAHGGLDINHPKGTPLWTPFTLDRQFLIKKPELGSRNIVWRGLRYWPDGTVWTIGVAHLAGLRAHERVPLTRGTHFADGAGTVVGAYEHSHFAFSIFEDGELLPLDPWLLFRQMYLDREKSGAPREAWFRRPGQALG